MLRTTHHSMLILSTLSLLLLCGWTLIAFSLSTCPKCGKPIESTWKFCKYCGEKLTHESNELPSKPGQTKINPKDGAEMVWIPAGEFIMGSNDGGEEEKPQHTVYLDGYWMYKYDVTVAQYRKFCGATGNARVVPAPDWGWQDDHPVVNVSWNDAKAYCDWAGVQLPTEAQWEKAARCTDGRKYPWGNEWDASKCATKIGNNHLSSTRRIGSYPQGVSPYGLYDMAGNVYQWCADWYDENYYKNVPNRNPTGPGSGQFRVLRGGSWNTSGTLDFRCAARLGTNPDYRSGVSGFRCVQGP